MLKTFRLLSVIEGISLILLFFVAMPLKYKFGIPEAVSYVGMAHGILFLSYFVMSLTVSHQEEWSVGFWLLVLFASLVPFAFLLLDRKLKPKNESVEQPETP